MSFSIRIPVGKDGKLEAAELAGDLPLHLLRVGDGHRPITVHGHAEEHGINMGVSFGGVHWSFFVPSDAWKELPGGCCPPAAQEQDEHPEIAEPGMHGLGHA